jgi:hypothetical protein
VLDVAVVVADVAEVSQLVKVMLLLSNLLNFYISSVSNKYQRGCSADVINCIIRTSP